MRPIRAVLFDWGDTLFASPDAAQVIVDAAAERGVAVPYAGARALWEEIWVAGKTPEELAKGRDLSMELHRAVWTSLFERADRVVPGIAPVLYERVLSQERWLPYANTEPTLRALRERGVRTGIVSNVPRELATIFAAHGLDALVDAFIHSYEVGVEKPDPRIFLAACERLGVPPEDTLMVGDHEVVSKGLSSAMTASSGLPWVDIQSNSWGTIANLPLDLGLQLAGLDPGKRTRVAVERGQTVLFASGNGSANAFESTSPTYGTSTAGPDWNVVVGAIRRDVERPIIGDGTPAHLSSWGDGNLPSACRTGAVSQCAFGGTSAATPYTSGVFGTVLTAIRQRIGDGGAGQRPGQVIAEGFPIPGSAYLSDGKLTRAELREAVLKTAFPLNQDNTQSIPIFPYPWTAPYNGDINVLFEGYGAATPNSAKRAIAVLMGEMPLPVRAAEDSFFALDRQIRDSLWGGYDRNGDGTKDSEAALGQFGLAEADVASADATWATMRKVASLSTPLATQTTGQNAQTFYLHREYSNEPGTTPSCTSNVTFMDQLDTAGDRELCFDSRATSILAAYRPLAMYPSTSDATIAIPAGSTVQVELYTTAETPTALRPTGVFMATDRELGSGSATPQPVVASGPGGVLCATLGEACWTRFSWSFQTTRHAIAGEQLTFQVQLVGGRSWAFGYEGAHASKITIIPAAIPVELDFGVAITEPAEGARLPEGGFTASGYATFPKLGTTEAGDHPTIKRVDVSVDDPGFANPIQATLTLNADETAGSWSAPIPAQSVGAHTLYVRASIDRTSSPVAQRAFTVEDTKTSPRVQWQVVPIGAAPAADGWRAASGVLSYSFAFDTRAYGKGEFDIYSRLVEGGAQTAITSVRAKFR